MGRIEKTIENQKRFDQLMNSWTEPTFEEQLKKYKKYGYVPSSGKRLPFTDEKITFMWKYDTVAFSTKFPGLSEYYMTVIDG